MPTEVTDAQDTSSTSTGTAAETTVEVAPEVTTASPGAQAESTPPAKETESDKFNAIFDKIAGEPKDEVKPESEAEVETAPEKTDEPGEGETEDEDPKALSQDQDQEQTKVPEKLTDRPEWQALTKIADKLGPAAGKEARKILRGVFKQQHDLAQAVEQSKPAQTVVQEIMKSVGGSTQGFDNMRLLINRYDSEPDKAIPMLEMLLDDARKRAGLVLQSPELLTESQKLDEAVKEGLMDETAAEKRRQELLELEQSRAVRKRTDQQHDQRRQQLENEQSRRLEEAWINETNTAETNWVKEKTKNDPDFVAVQDVWAAFAQTKALAFVNKEGKRPNGKESVQILEAALKDAKAQAMKFRPKPKAIQPVNGGNGSSGQHRQQPVTEEEKFNAIFDEVVARRK